MNIRLPTGNRKAFISVYFIFILLIVSSYISYITESICRYSYYLANLDDFRRINNVEVLIINRLKYQFQNYHERNQLIYYDGCAILITIDGRSADFIIMSHGVYRERVLEYDSENNVVETYY